MKPLVMVAIEGVCLAFLLIILSAYIILPRSRKLKNDGFFYSLVLTVAAILSDLIAWACELGPSPSALQYSSNFISLILTSLIVPAFGYYIVELINEKKPLSRNVAHVIAAVNIAAVVLTIVAAFCGKLFDIHADAANPGIMIYDDGGFLYEFPIIVSTLSLTFLFILVLRNGKVLGKDRIVVFIIYFVLPLFTGILEVFAEELQLSYVATSLSMCIVYVMLQSNHMNELLIREKLLNEISYVDQLTGLLNRRAFDRDMNLLKEDDTVNVVFCDLNGLKKINDEKGHQAGDQFLISFSEIIVRYFSHDFVYRISGDEFLVVTRNMTEGEFEESIASLKKEIDDNAGIAALGTITGKGDTIPLLVKKAEIEMYSNKKDFYRNNPDYER